MKKMKLLFVVVIIISMISVLIPNAYSSDIETYKISLIVKDNKNNEDINLYILLPKEYIEYAIDSANLDIDYQGVETIKDNDILGINVNKENIKNDLYIENNIEYVQILLEKNLNNEYTFDVLENYYGDEKIKLRIKNDSKDYIMHIDNFEIEEGICKIEYNYSENTIKQPDKIVINFGAIILIILLIIILIVIIITKQKND
mgnify:CR=1 FL=1